MKSDNTIEQNEHSGKTAEPVGAAYSENRRRLIRGGLIGAPILLALKSTPVLACNCKMPSGFSTSGNLSRNHGSTCTDPARKPSWWCNNYDKRTGKFTGTNISRDTKFKVIFGGTDSRTLSTVLNSGVNFSSLVAAAYIGISARYFVPGISTTDIKNMWNGTYKPRSYMPVWSRTDNENYLRYCMGLPLIRT